VDNEVVVGSEHVEGVMTGVEACLASGRDKRQLGDVLQYPRLLVRRRLVNDVVESQCALVRVRVVHVAFRIREVTTGLQSNRCGLYKAWYTLATKSTVAETGDKSTTKSTVADTVDFVASVYGAKATRSSLSTFNKVDRVEFNFVVSVYRALAAKLVFIATSPKIQLLYIRVY